MLVQKQVHTIHTRTSYKSKTCIVQTINSAYKGIPVLRADRHRFPCTRHIWNIIIGISEAQTQLGDVTTDTGVWLGNSLTCTVPLWHQKECLTKKSAYKNVYGKRDLTPFQGRVPPSTRGTRCVSPHVHQQPCFWRHSLQTGHKYQHLYRLWIRMLENSLQDLHTQISAILHRRNRARAGGTCEVDKGEVRLGWKWRHDPSLIRTTTKGNVRLYYLT